MMDKSSSNIKETNFSLVGLFFIWPAFLFIESIRNYRASYAKNALWLFIVFFGFTFIARDNNDAFRYIEWFYDIRETNISFIGFIRLLYSEETNYIDIVVPILSFVVAQFTGDYRILYAVFGLVFGYFYSRNVWYLIERTKVSLTIYSKILLIVFALIVPFWGINVIRFWLAAHVFFFGAIRFLLEGKTRGIWIAASSVLVHFSFVVPVIIILVYWVIGNRTVVFLIFFITCNLISGINISPLSDQLVEITPAVFQHRIEGYTSAERIELRQESHANRNWYVVWYKKALNIGTSILLVIVFFKGKEIWNRREEMNRLFAFVLLFSGFTTLSSLIPVFERFQLVGNLFSIAFLFLYFYYNDSDRISKKAFDILLPAFGLFIIVAIRAGFDNTSIYAFITNPIIAPSLNTNETALIDLIKGL